MNNIDYILSNTGYRFIEKTVSITMGKGQDFWKSSSPIKDKHIFNIMLNLDKEPGVDTFKLY